MAKQKHPCKHHPETLSAKRCFQCKDYICSACQKRTLHHLFCSYRCIVQYIIYEKLFKERRYREYAILLLIMIFIQIILLWLIYPHAEKSNSINSHKTSADSLLIQARSLQYSADTIFSSTRQSLKISGEAPANTLMGLWNNGSYLAAAVSGNNGYEFPLQSLTLGKNAFVIWGLSENGKTTLVDSISIEYSSPRISAIAVPLSRSLTDHKILALTFDGGSAANGADSIVTILSDRNIKTTFFLTGKFIIEFPDIVQKMIDNNHELANHTRSHPHLTSFADDNQHHTLDKVNRDFVLAQLNQTDSLLYSGFASHLKPYWRAPFGEYNQEILLWAAEAGYKHVGWSRGGDTRDWINDQDSPYYRSAEDIYDYLIDMESRGQLQGAILLMHLHSDRIDDMPYKILPKLINFLKNKGYRLVTISDLIHATSPI